MAGVVAECLFFEEQRDQGNMARVHGLDGKPFGVDLDVDHLNKLLERVNDLPEDGALIQSCLKHRLSGKLLI